MQAPGIWVGQITQALRERNGPGVVKLHDPNMNLNK